MVVFGNGRGQPQSPAYSPAHLIALAVALALAGAKPAPAPTAVVAPPVQPLSEASYAIKAGRLEQARLMIGNAIKAGAKGTEMDRLIADLAYASRISSPRFRSTCSCSSPIKATGSCTRMPVSPR